MANPISDILESSLKSLRDIVDVNTVIGEPTKISDDITIIPVSKVSFGYGGGGSGYPTKKETKDTFGGATGAGATVEPVAFLIIQDGNVKLLQISTSNSTADKVVNLVPEVIDKVSGIIDEKKAKKACEPKPL
ncbi:MAG: spore germination protein GerW family protein [Oscillospiraceae bacterium]